MKLLQVYNQYRTLFGGEETVVRQIEAMAQDHGVETLLLMRSSRGLDDSAISKARAALASVYNPFAARHMSRYITTHKPDIAHVHNLYPLFSPSVLVALRRAGVPIVMTVHNHFHTCPTAANFFSGAVCEKCFSGREFNCITQNCRENLVESTVYALRSTVARKLGLFTRTVSTIIALNEFARGRLVGAGFDSNRVVVLPNAVKLPPSPADASQGKYAIYSGRMCPEKGVDTLLEAAAQVPEIPVHLLGGGFSLDGLRRSAPPNAIFFGQMSPEKVTEAYRSARFLVVPSRWFEGCPLVILEAMSHGLPVIASRIGGLPEIVQHGTTGLLFEPGDGDDLAEKMRDLWGDPERCEVMGAAAYERAAREFNREHYWGQLEKIYLKAAANGLPTARPPWI